jgi:exodeoxyribonuclease VII small subunit
MAKGAKESASFENSVQRLEEIVEQMESADLPLDQIIDRYEEGMKLLQVCEDKLKAAEAKIELLTKDKSGNISRSELNEVTSVEITKDEIKSGSEEVSLF